MSVGSWIALATLAVGLITLAVVLHLVSLMKNQTRIMQKQDELLARRADFIVSPNVEILKDSIPKRLRLKLSVKNIGNKSARDFYWYIRVPKSLREDGFMNLGDTIIRNEIRPSHQEMRGAAYDEYSALYEGPLYPNRQGSLGTLYLVPPSSEKSFVVYWQIVSEEGVFPSKEFGALEITPRSGPRREISDFDRRRY